MAPLILIPLVLSGLLSSCWARVVFKPEGFLKIPDSKGATSIGIGTANKAAYDSVSNLLYVIGHNADVLNVLDMRDSLTNPVLGRTTRFDALNQGLPNDIKICRGGLGREFLAISFESKDLTERGHVHFYQLLSDPNEVLLRLKTVTTVEGFDPRTIAWNSFCSELIVASVGLVHTINGAFEDPRPSVDVLVPSFGLNVDRRSMPFSENAIKSAGVREVFSQCDSGTHTALSSHVQDMEPVHVTVDDDDVAYLLFQTNNAIGRMDLRDPFAPMTYHNLGLKDWSQYSIDTSYEDGGINLNPHVMKSMYQPGSAIAFTLANKTWLATADGGAIKSYSVRSGSTTLCNFAESAEGRTWNQAFSSALDPNVATELQKNLTTITSRMRFSRLKSIQDGYNPLQMGYNYLTTYGGRGWSLLDTSTMQRVYDSGDILESFYTTPDVNDKQKSVFNGYYVASNQAQTQYTDRTSPLFGPNPTAITAGKINDTQVVVVANGYMGGLYFFSVAVNGTGPEVKLEGFERRGSPGITWGDAFKMSDDSVGEPGITDLLWISDEGQNVVVAISSIANVASFYSVDLQEP